MASVSSSGHLTPIGLLKAGDLWATKEEAPSTIDGAIAMIGLGLGSDRSGPVQILWHFAGGEANGVAWTAPAALSSRDSAVGEVMGSSVRRTVSLACAIALLESGRISS
jgi:hypothetical protein